MCIWSSSLNFESKFTFTDCSSSSTSDSSPFIVSSSVFHDRDFNWLDCCSNVLKDASYTEYKFTEYERIYNDKCSQDLVEKILNRQTGIPSDIYFKITKPQFSTKLKLPFIVCVLISSTNHLKYFSLQSNNMNAKRNSF